MRRIRSALQDPVAFNSLALMANTVVTSGFGYLFWILVVRLAGTHVSGLGAAFASAIQLVTLIASVGASAALIEWLPRADNDRRWRQLVTTAMVVSNSTSLVGAAVFIALELSPLRPIDGMHTTVAIGAFVVSCLVFAANTVLDYVCISEVRGVVLLLRGTLLTGLRIPAFLLATLVMSDINAMFVGWAVASALSLLFGILAFDRVGGDRHLRPEFTGLSSHLARMRHSFVGQHLITVTAMLASYLLPLIVTVRLGAVENSYFYITWMLGSVFFIISPAVSTALFAASASDPAATAALARRSMLMILALLIVPVVVYLFGGRLLLDVFGGREFEHAGGTLLVLLTFSAFPDAVTNVAVSALRATGRMGEALAINAGMVALTIVGSWVSLPGYGIVSVGFWWLVAQSIGAVWVLVNWRRITWAEAVDDIPDPEVAW